MNDVAEIIGGEKVIAIYESWPAFHDAEVHSIACECDEKKVIIVLVLDAAMAHVTLRFDDCEDVRLEGFGRQNVLFELGIERQVSLSRATFNITLDASVGLEGGFVCRGIEVLDVDLKARSS